MSEKEKGNLKSQDRTTNFPKLMQELDGGVIANVVGLAMSNVALAVSHSEKQGEVHVKFKMKPMGTNNEITKITCNIKVNEPKMKFGSKVEDFQYESIAYIGKGGKLTYEQPKEDVNSQMNINGIKQLKEVRG